MGIRARALIAALLLIVITLPSVIPAGCESYFTGSVGIGTNTPKGMLGVHSAETGTNILVSRFSSSPSVSGNYNYIAVGDGAGSGDAAIFGYVHSGQTAQTGAFIAGGRDRQPSQGIFVQYGGRVGIGTTSPSGVLDVVAADSATAIQTKSPGGTPRFALNNLADGSWTIYDYASGAYAAGITQKSGAVGIGTTTPQQRLDIAGSISLGGGASGGYGAGGGGTSGNGIRFPSSANDMISVFGEHDGADTSNLVFQQNDNPTDGVIFRNSDCCGGGTKDYMKISRAGVWYAGDGNVGIGTASPSALLDVQGMLQLNDLSVEGTSVNSLHRLIALSACGGVVGGAHKWLVDMGYSSASTGAQACSAAGFSGCNAVIAFPNHLGWIRNDYGCSSKGSGYTDAHNFACCSN
ncbi:hypothetical protein HYY74_04010 [Candidatus Woesearchaeota archaeon]|nr:hypothetical protein [Candidatus Woesearchaeota archaeon]